MAEQRGRRSTLAPLLGIVLSACSSQVDPDVPDDQTVSLKVGEQVYEVPLAHRPITDEWGNSAELYDRILAGDGVRGKPLEVSMFSVELDPVLHRTGRATYLNFFDLRSRLPQAELTERAVTRANVSSIELSFEKPSRASPTSHLYEATGTVLFHFRDGASQAVAARCDYVPEGAAATAPAYLGCSLRVTIAGGNSLHIKSSPGPDLEKLAANVWSAIALVDSFQP